ncbi:type I glutamate--ammonia ligase [Piscirickettsia litoralis]|uniref:hypothetical protein n=1 Tax=Piscirickettsia litoralis TaxID=1891921 RepID=UPI001911441C|nr:hypothetical protein [Piscirickettsia litoralis]
MPKQSGMLTLEQLKAQATNNEVNTVLVVFTDQYGRFLGKRLDVDFFLESALEKGVGACNYLLTTDMQMNPMPGYDYANWQKGYGDFVLVPDLLTLRLASWLDKTALVICDVYADERQQEKVNLAPRSVLTKQVEKAKALGFNLKAASELEYYIFEQSYKDAAKKNYQDLAEIGWYIEDYHVLQGSREEKLNGAARQHLKQSGIAVEKLERGVGAWPT